MNRKLKVGVVGAGAIGQTYIEVLKGIEEVHLVAVSECDSLKMTKVAQAYGVNGYKDADEMLKKEEIDAVVNRASELGVKVLLNHPYYGFDAQTRFVEGWARLGAYVELTAVWFLLEGSKSYGVLSDLFSRIPMEKFVLDSDMGQANLESSIDGLYKFIEILMREFKLTEQQINLIGKETPSKIMGI